MNSMVFLASTFSFGDTTVIKKYLFRVMVTSSRTFLSVMKGQTILALGSSGAMKQCSVAAGSVVW